MRKLNIRLNRYRWSLLIWKTECEQPQPINLDIGSHHRPIFILCFYEIICCIPYILCRNCLSMLGNLMCFLLASKLAERHVLFKSAIKQALMRQFDGRENELLPHISTGKWMAMLLCQTSCFYIIRCLHEPLMTTSCLPVSKEKANNVLIFQTQRLIVSMRFSGHF